MDAAAIVERLRAALPESVTASDPAARDPWVQVLPADVARAIRFLRDDPDLAFDSMMSLAGLDLTGLQETPDLRVVYHLFSYLHRHTIVVRADVPRDAASVPSIVELFPGADWHEREAFDLFGITFEGHPDLRRLLLPPEWEGHPLRKDYVQGETVLGFPATRRSLLEELRAGGEK